MANEIFAPSDIMRMCEEGTMTYSILKMETGNRILTMEQQALELGYLLKVARDTDVLSSSGYFNYLDFARKEFGIDKGAVSKLIGINDRFSKGGNSMEFAPEYTGFGKSKLMEMLPLPDYINETLEPELSKSEIMAIKEEYGSEKEITDIEVMLEDDESGEDSLIGAFFYKLFKNAPETYESVYDTVKSLEGKGMDHITAVMRALCPGSLKIYYARPEGFGKIQLKFSDSIDGGELLSIRTGEKEIISREEITEAASSYIEPCMERGMDCKAAYENMFGVKIPEVSPVKLPKDSRVVIAKDTEKEKAEYTDPWVSKEEKVKKAPPLSEDEEAEDAGKECDEGDVTEEDGDDGLDSEQKRLAGYDTQTLVAVLEKDTESLADNVRKAIEGEDDRIPPAIAQAKRIASALAELAGRR